jgi:hypothetical protein
LGDDFRADVIDGATESLSGAGGMHRPPEITELNDVILAEKDILRFQVSVDDVQAV